MRRLSFILAVSTAALAFGIGTAFATGGKAARTAPRRAATHARHLRGRGAHRPKRSRARTATTRSYAGTVSSSFGALTTLAPIASASDPVLLGDQAVESGRDSNAAGLAEAFPFSAQLSGTALTLNVYLDSTSSAGRAYVGLFSSRDGAPAQLITSGASSNLQPGTWNAFSLNPASVVAGQRYWVAVLGQNGTLAFRDRASGPCSSQNSAQSNLSSLPSSWASGASWDTCPISAYVGGTAAAVAASAPANTAVPSVSGNATVGQTLSTSQGSWSGGPTGFSYVWNDCDGSGANCSTIPGASAPTYAVQASDVGHTLVSVVTATNSAGSTSASSAPTPVVTAGAPPANTARPVVSGSTAPGQTLSTTNGGWSNSPTGFSYAWKDCDSAGANCTVITGASSSSYTLGSGDVGHTVVAVVTASNAGGTNSASSAPTAPVSAPSSPPPSRTSLLGDQAVESSQDGGTGTSEAFGYPASASGVVTDANIYLTSTDGVAVGLYADNAGKPGARLDSGSVTTNAAGWVDVPLSKGVQLSQGTRYWLAIAAVSSGATVSYRDSGNGGTNLDYSGNGLADPYSVTGQWGSNPASVYLSGTPAAPTAPSSGSPPGIAGTAQQGSTLTASVGMWSGTAPISYTYQWRDNGRAISGATGQTYAPTAADVGNSIDVVVTGTNSVGSASATSGAVGPIAGPPPAPQNTALPAISGTAQAGDQLTATTGSWTNGPTSYSYQWQDCASGTCTNISGATGSSYLLQASDVGDTVDVVVAAKNAGGSNAATSAQTAAVAAAAGFSPLHVSGTLLQNASGQSVFLHGADRSGTEYTCINGGGFFDGTGSDFASEDAQIASMAAWGINAEVIPINEDCWLGINGAPAANSDSSASPPTPGCSASQCPYANAIENLVKTDEANHIYPIISGFWMASGTTQARAHIQLADNDHAPLMWEELANFFKSDPYVMFRLEQEPILDWSNEAHWQCWAQGDVSYGTGSDSTPPTAPTATGTPNACSGQGIGYTTVGMQSLVNIVRGAGASNVVALSGLGYANMLSCAPTTSPTSCGMLAAATPAVTDSLNPSQLMASVDVYPESNVCGNQLNTSCYDTTYKPVAQVMPLIAGETGENGSGTSTTTYVDMFMNWMDANGNGYDAWGWDPWADLISGYTNNNAPSTTWGRDYYNHIHSTTPVR